MAKAKVSRGTYARERVRLTADHTRRAAALIASGRVEGRGLEFADVGCAGLILRVTPLSAAWLLKTERSTVRLADMDALLVAAAREAAVRTKLALKDGRDPAPDLVLFERALERTGDVEASAEAAFAEEAAMPSDPHRRKHGPWTWSDLVAEFLAVKVPTLKPAWAAQYPVHLSYAAFDRIAARPLSSLTIEDLKRARDEIAEATSPSSAARAVNQGKAALDWAWRYHARRSRLGRDPCWQRWSIEYAAGTRDHEPTLAELGRTLALAERHRTLGSTDRETGVETIAALWGAVLTGQRTGALTVARHDRVIPLPGRPDWQVWTWSGTDMKGGRSGGRPHALPIPPVVIETLARFDEPGTEREWIFPSSQGGKHVTSEGIAQLLTRLQGREKPGRTGKTTTREDLFKRHRIRSWVPHDIRRDLATFLDDEDLGGAAAAILAHKSGKKDDEAAWLEDVTRKVYARAQRLDLKARGMELWVAAVLDAYRQEAAALDRAASTASSGSSIQGQATKGRGP